MTAAPANRHATAIVLGSTGILFVGPSGAGKSACALSCLVSAQAHKLYGCLIADDQVMVHAVNGRVIAEAPETIGGLMEIRGSGIARMDHIAAAVIDLVVELKTQEDAERLPPSGRVWQAADGLDLPLITMTWPSPDPFSKLAALCPALLTGAPARPDLLFTDR